MSDYAINIFWSDEDDQYIATVPDLKGCSASGDTPQEALAEVLIAKDLWLEAVRDRGWDIPKPLWKPPTEAAQAAG